MDDTAPVNPDDQTARIDRRDLLTGVGLLAAASLGGSAQIARANPLPDTPLQAGAAHVAVPVRDEALLTLTANEAAFLAAAVDRLIPTDDLSPSASQAGVVVFIDRQLAGAWGSGARLYRSGPFVKGKPEQGYQLPLTPREFFGAGIAAADHWVRATHDAPLDRLTPAQRDAVLSDLEAGRAELGTVPARAFFDAMLAITVEGFFADPIYGGNRDKAGWKVLGYPGLPATYANAVRNHKGTVYAPAPRSIEDFL
jgi:gluconate 2-dehydrogenase gamma chain